MPSHQAAPILSIAGYDPSHGAGLVRDALTCHDFNQTCVSVCTANTIQTDTQFISCNWQPKDIILQQLKTILSEYSIQFCKIGIIENKDILQQCIDLLRAANKTTFILWDPIIHSSTGFQFLDSFANEVFDYIDCITPNNTEYETLVKKVGNDVIQYFNQTKCTIIKSYEETPTHYRNKLITGGDELYFKSKKYNSQLHGSGCRFSSAFLSIIAQGKSIQEAFKTATQYLEDQYRQAAKTSSAA